MATARTAKIGASSTRQQADGDVEGPLGGSVPEPRARSSVENGQAVPFLDDTAPAQEADGTRYDTDVDPPL